MNINSLMQFHENPVIVNWWLARFGKVLAWLTPFKRRAILAMMAIYVCAKISLREMTQASDLGAPTDKLGLAIIVFVIFAILWLCYRVAVNFKTLPVTIRHHPQLALHLMYWGGLVVLWFTLPTDGLWRSVLLGVAVIFPYLIWRCGYMLISGSRVSETSFFHQLILLVPVFGGSDVPYGKGLDYISKFEAQNAEALARSQLAGIKLIILACFYRVGINVIQRNLYGTGCAIPPLGHLLELGSTAPFLVSWVGIYCELIWQVLERATEGHMIIGALRFFGFNVFRNTYKPLLSETVVEFWNRYYYYFKELLLNFFFMPVFMQLGSLFNKWPRLRLFIAVFASAFAGNMYYHLLRHGGASLVLGDVFEKLYSMRSQFFYGVLLAIGIYISMLRKQYQSSKAQSTDGAARIMRIFSVWTFFSLIFIWDVNSHASFLTRVDFFLNLFRLHA